MKKVIILIVLLTITSLLFAENDTLAVIDTLTAEEISAERGFITAIYHIYREDVLPWFQDFPDSTILYWYPDNKQTGILYYDMRSEIWVGLPIMDEPKQRCIWRKNKVNKIKEVKE